MKHDDYTVGWISALPTETAAAQGMLDELHSPLSQSPFSATQVTLGRIGSHNVVIACLPDGQYGVTSAALVAKEIKLTFTSIRIGLMVGIGGGVPQLPNYDIRLGDVVVSRPTNTNGGVIQYDLGKKTESGEFQRVGQLNSPPAVLLSAVAKVRANHLMNQPDLLKHVSAMIAQYPDMKEQYSYQGTQDDKLFEASYDHVRGHNNTTCVDCDANRLLLRPGPARDAPYVHYGLIASGNQVIKDAKTRDSLRARLRDGGDGETLCFEMEAAGLMNEFPCLVIRGICDYADTHKNKDWQHRAAAVAAAYAKELLCVVSPSQVASTSTAPEALSDIAAPPKTYFSVSRARVHDFVGRERQLSDIISYFSPSRVARPRCMVLHALGGQGKSQIALEYCWRSREIYRGIFWINAGSKQAAVQSYQLIARELTGQPSVAPDDNEVTISQVKSHLQQWNERWLLVFDNFDEPDTFQNVRQFFPGGRGDVLVTSRNNGLSRLGKLLEIPPMPTEEGLRLLLHEYDYHDVQQHAASGSRIVARLGGLALAIDQAAAYIRDQGLSLNKLDSFLETYESQRKKILKYTPDDLWEYGTMQIHGDAEQSKAISAFTTWEMSFQQLGTGDEQRKTDIAHFLTLSAFLNPLEIGESLFRQHWEAHTTHPAWMRLFCQTNDESDSDDLSDDGDDQQWNSDRFWELIAKAYKLSLLQRVSRGDGQRSSYFSIHPLIRDWLQVREKAEQRHRYTQESYFIVSDSIARCEADRDALEQRMALLAHADTCLSNDAIFSKSRYRLGGEDTSCAPASWFAGFYQDQGRYDRAENLHRRVLETQIRINRQEHPDTFTSMNNLARALDSQGKYEQAEDMHRQALTLRETVLGKEHPHTLNSMNNLAEVLANQGKYKQAENMHRQALTLIETVLGKEHPYTLASMNNLAEVLLSQGKYEQAEEMHRQELKMCETVLGKEHPATLTSMNNLAEVLLSQGKYEQAENMHRQALSLRETVLGKEHPDTLGSMNNLAKALDCQGKYEQAENMHRQALTLKETVLGKEHPRTLNSMNNLAEVLADQGKYEQAENMHRQVLTLRETVLGKEHPDTLTSMSNLAGMYWRQNRLAEAESLEVQALEIRLHVLGQEHPDTLSSMANLAYTWKSQGRNREAITLMTQANKGQSEILGSEHPSAKSSAQALEAWLTSKSDLLEGIDADDCEYRDDGDDGDNSDATRGGNDRNTGDR